MEPTSAQGSMDPSTHAVLRTTPGNPFTPLHTALYIAAWLLVMVQGWGARIGSDPTTWLYDPAGTAARIVTRDLEFAEANSRAGEASLVGTYLSTSYDDALAAAIAMHLDAGTVVANRVDTGQEPLDQLDRVNARLAILYAEAGNPIETRLRVGDVNHDVLRAALAVVYAEQAESQSMAALGDEAIVDLAGMGIEDWFLERAAIRVLLRAGENETAARVIETIDTRGRALQRRNVFLTSINFAMIAIGLIAFVGLVRRRTSLNAGPSCGAPPWSSSLGFAVMVRADFWNRLLFASLVDLGTRLSNPTWLDPFYTWGSLIASLPLFWLAYRYLFKSSWQPVASTLGVSATKFRSASVLRITAAVIAINLAGVSAIAWGSYWLGYGGGWAEGLDETLLFGTTTEVVQSCIDYLVTTPVAEELLFRGLLFYTLRHRLGATAAAFASALFFSAIHFYSLPGFLMTFWSGFVWALSFEYARSLLPGIVAHSFYNLLFVAGMLFIYR